MSWLRDDPWVLWLILAVLLGIAEVSTLDLLFLMLAAGALGGAATAAVGAPFVLSAVVALVVAVAMLGVVRPVALRHLRAGAPETRTGTAALVGRQALVLERVDGHEGRVRLGGEVWSARSYDPSTPIAPGTTVDVVSIEGATAVVLASDYPPPANRSELSP